MATLWWHQAQDLGAKLCRVRQVLRVFACGVVSPELLPRSIAHTGLAAKTWWTSVVVAYGSAWLFC
jgi:hypothetical protein